jgi:hypothetical protein
VRYTADQRRLYVRLTVIIATICVGCGSSEGGGIECDDAGGTLDYLPLAVGATWTYRVTDLDDLTTKDKDTEVEAIEAVPDSSICAYRIRTDKSTGITVSWQQVDGDHVERFAEESYDNFDFLEKIEIYDPYKLRIDESLAHLTQDATWTDSYVETVLDYVASTEETKAKIDDWRVVSASESVTVPAGIFDCVHFHRSNAETLSEKDYWFADGIGKVKEVGDNQREELVSFE